MSAYSSQAGNQTDRNFMQQNRLNAKNMFL